MVVAEAVAQFEAEWVAGLLQLDAGFQQSVPGVGKVLDADFAKPIGAPVHELADVAERDRFPLAVDDHQFFDEVVPTAIFLADRFGDVADIDELVVEQEWPAEIHRRYVWAVAGLSRCGYAGLQAADADQLVIYTDAGGLGVFRNQRLFHVVVVSRNERTFVHEAELFVSRIACAATKRRAGAGEACDFQHVPA